MCTVVKWLSLVVYVRTQELEFRKLLKNLWENFRIQYQRLLFVLGLNMLHLARV